MPSTIGLGNCPVIDDSFKVDAPDLNAGMKGHKPRDWVKYGYGAVRGTAPFPPELIIEEKDWDYWAEKEEAEQSSIEHISDALGIKVKDQGQTNYCWINAPTHCVELLRAMMGLGYVELSPASVGAIINDFQNEGGYGAEAVEFLAKRGSVPVSLWPANAIDKKYNTAAADAERGKYQIDAWWDLHPRTPIEYASCLFRKMPIAVGLNWWGHEVTYIRWVKVNGVWGPKFDNSWGMGWGDKGRGTLIGKKALADDGIAPRLVTAA